MGAHQANTQCAQLQRVGSDRMAKKGVSTGVMGLPPILWYHGVHVSDLRMF